MFDIRVTDPKSEFHGQILKGSCFYYDIRHTGDSDDLYVAESKDGRKINLLSSQIDEKHYHNQELEKVTKEIGANIGDKVIILETGSDSYSRDWETKGVHTITKIDFTGHVTFDNGNATIFRPKVKVVTT
ncbi:hypothetical protein [Clostridium sporogenes]|uniref:hypothetical protein n=1 Tax=Clostridium sporogenes TaxID=1509 RepID=UPI0006B25B07|nr:hypothetical protein [Clostridium sporogenes]KOY65462.1 hypothetical protein AN649_13385 [Clostridium sporogenes]